MCTAAKQEAPAGVDQPATEVRVQSSPAHASTLGLPSGSAARGVSAHPTAGTRTRLRSGSGAHPWPLVGIPWAVFETSPPRSTPVVLMSLPWDAAVISGT